MRVDETAEPYSEEEFVDIDVRWSAPMYLEDGTHEHLLYTVPDWDAIPDVPGVYVFSRQHGERVSPIYIGRARSLQGRLWQQFNNVRLMKGIEAAPNGYRALFLGVIEFRQGQRTDSVLRVVEAALINAAFADGFDLLNVQGKNNLVHTIHNAGNRVARDWMERTVFLRRSE